MFAAGAASLAVWVDVRFPRIGPAELRGVIVHAICAFGLFFASDTLYSMVAGGEVWRSVIALLAVELSVLTYMLIVGLWTLKVVRGALSAVR
jgi:hypothetical protein